MNLNELLTALVTNGIGMVCAAAVLWFAYYRETKTLPALMKTFSDASSASTNSFEERNQKVLDTFALVIREERQTCQKWHEENRQRLDQMLLEQKENRHYLRELAHQMGMKKVIEQQREFRDREAEGRAKPEG